MTAGFRIPAANVRRVTETVKKWTVIDPERGLWAEREFEVTTHPNGRKTDRLIERETRK